MTKIGFIGYGKMAEYMANGITEKNSYEITVFDKNIDRLKLAKQKKLKIASKVDEIFNSNIIILAIKPQNLSELTDKIVDRDKTIISLLAGVKIEKIQNKFKNAKIIRIMPNLPISQKLGTIAIHSKEKIDSNVFKILNSISTTFEITEDKFDEFTAISGSAPAYIFEFMKIYEESCTKYGFKNAKDIVISNIKGAVAMYENSKDSLDKLVDSVCSKGGTTIEAISHFRNMEMNKIISDGIEKCKLRSEELSKV